MAAITRVGFSFMRNTILSNAARSVSTTNPLNLKEIRERKENSTIIVEGVTVSSPRTELLVKPHKIPDIVEQNKSLLESRLRTDKEPCYMCALGLDVKHTDVLILSQFIRSDGCMLPKRITGLCKRQQKKIGKMVTMAQKAGLLINMTPKNCNKDPTKRRDWKKFNTYFDEKTIFMRRIPNQNDKFAR